MTNNLSNQHLLRVCHMPPMEEEAVTKKATFLELRDSQSTWVTNQIRI